MSFGHYVGLAPASSCASTARKYLWPRKLQYRRLLTRICTCGMRQSEMARPAERRAGWPFGIGLRAYSYNGIMRNYTHKCGGDKLAPVDDALLLGMAAPSARAWPFHFSRPNRGVLASEDLKRDQRLTRENMASYRKLSSTSAAAGGVNRRNARGMPARHLVLGIFAFGHFS